MDYKILIIDNDKIIHNSIKSILSYSSLESEYLFSSFGGYDQMESNSDSTSYSVDDAYQGIDGFNLVKNAKTDKSPYLIVFIDTKIPLGWDGVRTAQEIRKIDALIHIVFISTFLDKNRDNIIAQIGGAENLIFLRKPFFNSEIESLVMNLSH